MSEGHRKQQGTRTVGLYPHARRVGDLLFLSGVGPRERGTKKIPGVELDADGTSPLRHRGAVPQRVLQHPLHPGGRGQQLGQDRGWTVFP